uniref:RNA-binding protein 39 n=1 Tax=Rhizophora mucronata TaxID=61149 RepID=A0A2P2LEJ7_RHIMU
MKLENCTPFSELLKSAWIFFSSVTFRVLLHLDSRPT